MFSTRRVPCTPPPRQGGAPAPPALSMFSTRRVPCTPPPRQGWAPAPPALSMSLSEDRGGQPVQLPGGRGGHAVGERELETGDDERGRGRGIGGEAGLEHE